MTDIRDRRKTGINRVRISNGNGEKLDVYTMTANRIRVWAAALIAVFMVLGVAYSAARYGVGFEVKKVIGEECRPPAGMIYQEIESRSQLFLEEIQGVIQDDLDVFDKRFEKQEGEIKKQGELGIRLEERQIAMDEKIDDKHTEVLRAIRQTRDPCISCHVEELS